MLRSCLRWGYLFAVFSFLALIVAFFFYGRQVILPTEPGITLFYKAGFVFATPLVTSLGIESLFAHVMLAGFFQILVSFGIGMVGGLLYQFVRH